MWRNSLSLPLAALVIAALGAVLILADFALRSGPHSASSGAASSGGAKPEIDGRIAEGEYAHSYRDETGIELYWTVVGEEIYFGLRSPGEGWVALSLAPKGPMMQGGDIIIGYISNGELHIQDNYADSPAGHKADPELGGSDDILEAAGSEGEGGTVLEFKRRLDTGDEYDHPITAGEMAIQLAYSEKDDFTSYHAERASITLRLLEGG